MKTATILEQGELWSVYFKGFDFADFISPTRFPISMPAAIVIEKLAAFPANKDVESWQIANW